MQNFLRSIFTNRFGLTLAIINLAIISFVRSGAATLLGMENFQMLVFLANLPARLASMIFTNVVFGPALANRFDINHYSLDMLILVFLQWLFIGWLAQKVATAIRAGGVVSREL